MIVPLQRTIPTVRTEPKSAQKQPKQELSEDEAAAVRAELVRLVEALGGKRAVGVALGFPPRSDSQTIERAIRIRPGREVATKLYAYLKTTREVFLAAHGIAAPLTAVLVDAGQDEASWVAAGFTDEASRRLATAVRAELAAMKKRR